MLGGAGTGLGGALARGNKLITVGCPVVSQHMVAEVTGRYRSERPGLPAVSLSENAASLTAITNDYGRDRVYLRQLDALAQPGDFVLGFMAGGGDRPRPGGGAPQKKRDRKVGGGSPRRRDGGARPA